ncbi:MULTISPECIES: DUF397 domain-containing protein [Streptomyces]|uniref:DUF397 domain-containing protein n=1 Tax=Streptomyces TaxID=1883 RepID=UPI0004BF78DE|nr:MULTISPECIES: DUF397 domain-containing protein [Streptomyces]MDX3275245.1 DUF397 domain-containing protein [Streptomyces scabiei]MDX3846990.1 DUF397 domain-containing protein [Streptomyces europaeiscabiei]
MTQELKWWKSSYSGQNGGDCIECAVPSPVGTTGAAQDVIHVRDSKNKKGAHLTFPAASWNCFVAAANRGEFGTA